MTFSVEYSKQADKDLYDIEYYISHVLKNPTAAKHTIKGILSKTDLLVLQPEMGTQFFNGDGKLTGYRYVIYKNYLAFYHVYGNVIHVDRVIYGRRNYFIQIFD